MVAKTDQRPPPNQAATWRLLAEVSLPGQPAGGSRSLEPIMSVVTRSLLGLRLPVTTMQRINILVDDAAGKARRGGDRGGPALPLHIRVFWQNNDRQMRSQARPAVSDAVAASTSAWGISTSESLVSPPILLGALPEFRVEIYLYPEGR